MGKELFKNIPSKVRDLVRGVQNGQIGLPDLQRPFVWKDSKVREGGADRKLDKLCYQAKMLPIFPRAAAS